MSDLPVIPREVVEVLENVKRCMTRVCEECDAAQRDTRKEISTERVARINGDACGYAHGVAFALLRQLEQLGIR